MQTTPEAVSDAVWCFNGHQMKKTRLGRQKSTIQRNREGIQNQNDQEQNTKVDKDRKRRWRLKEGSKQV